MHDDSKPTTLPVAREIVDVYVRDSVKLPWYIDLLNITLGTSDLQKAKSRIALLAESFRKDGTQADGEPRLGVGTPKSEVRSPKV